MKTSLRRTPGQRRLSLSPIVLLLVFAALGTLATTTASAAPILRIDTTHRVFDSTKVRITTTAYDTIRLTNSGTGLLTVDSVRIYGATASSYSVLHTPDTAVAAGQNDYIAVSFHPTSTGLKHDSLVVYSNGGTASRTLNGIGVSPAIAISNDLIDFDSVRVGSETCRPIYITNTGTDTLAILKNYLADPSTSYYYLGLDSTDSLIAPNVTRAIGICFTPKTDSVLNTRIAIKPNIPGDTATRYIEITGIGVRVSGLTPTALKLTSAIIGQSTCETDTLISGGGQNNVIITSVKVTGPDSSAVTLTLPSLPDTVKPDSAFIYTFCVNPTHRGTLDAAITVTYKTLGLQESATIPLSINGQQVCASTTPLRLFTTPTLLGTSDTATFTVTNCGDVETRYTATQPSNTAFHIVSNTTSAVIAPGSSTTFTVTYTPTSGGNPVDTITVTGGTGVSPMYVTLAGVPGLLQITGTDTIPDVPVGTCKDFTVHLHNTGNMTWTSGMPIIIGAKSADYSVKNAASITLAPDSSTDITVTFCPKSIATETATITYPTASPNVSTQISLIGRGVVNGVDEMPSTAFAVQSVYPNPAANTATVTYYLPTSADVRVELIDTRGALIHLLQNGHATEGSHDITLDTKSLPNGNYFILVTANGTQLTKSVTVMH